MPFKGTRHGNGVADGAVAKLLQLWQHASALWRHAVWIRIVTSHNAWMGYEYSLQNMNRTKGDSQTWSSPPRNNGAYAIIQNITSRQWLTHWGRDKRAAIFQTTFSNGFSWMELYDFRLKFHGISFLEFELTLFQHWFRLCLGADQATSHYLNQWWLVHWRIYASLGLNELNIYQTEGDDYGTSAVHIQHRSWYMHTALVWLFWSVFCWIHNVYNIERERLVGNMTIDDRETVTEPMKTVFRQFDSPYKSKTTTP